MQRNRHTRGLPVPPPSCLLAPKTCTLCELQPSHQQTGCVAHLVPRLRNFHIGHSSGYLVGAHHLTCASHFLKKGQSRVLLGSVGLSKPCLFLTVEWHHQVSVPPHQYRCGHSWHWWFPETEELILPVRCAAHLRPLGGCWDGDTRHFTLWGECWANPT